MTNARSVSQSRKTLRRHLSFRPVAVLAAGFAALLTTGLVAGPLAGAPAGAATKHALATTGLGYTPLTAPVRIADTRAGASDPATYAGKTLAPGASVTVDVPTADVPANASAVVVNVTAISPSAAGFLTVFPGGGTNPGTANVTFTGGQTVGNQVTVGLGSDSVTGAAQSFTVFNGPATGGGSVDFAADLVGYYAPQSATSGDAYVGLTPARIYDSRAGSGQTGAGTTLTGGGSANVTVTGVGGVPASATAVVLNVAVTNTTASSFITAFPTGQPQPGTASQNFLAGETLSSQVVAAVGTGGDVTIANHAGNADIVVDVDGYFTAAGGTGSLLNVLAAPVRLTDTRPTGVGGGSSATATVQGAGATAGVLSVADIATKGSGNFLTAFPTGGAAPTAATVNYTPGDTYNIVENAAYATTGTAGSVSILNGPSNAATANVVVDEFGYFAPQASNQTFTVTPAAPAPVTVGTDVQYTATGLGTAPVNVELFPAANVTTANGATTFVAAGGVASPGIIPGGTSISVVNGTAQTGSLISAVTPIGGQVTFTVHSTNIGAFTPVVFTKAAGNNNLAVAANGTPTQTFGVGGVASFNAAAAPNGTVGTALDVISVNATAGTFQAFPHGTTTGALTYSFNTPGSTYAYQAAPAATGPFPINEAQFASYIGTGDVLATGLAYNSAGPSNTFTLTTDVPSAPTAVTAAYSATATPPGVVLTWTLAVNPDITGYTVDRATVTAGVVGGFSALAGGTVGPTITTFTDITANASPGSTFAYEVIANGSLNNAGTTNGPSPASNVVQVTVPASAFAALPSAPVSLSTTLSPATTTGFVSTGDVLQTSFNQPLNALTGAASVTITDTAGDVGTLTNGVNATFALAGTSQSVLSITLTAPPALSTGSSLSYTGAHYTASNGITGVPTAGGAGSLAWDLVAAHGAGPAVMGEVTIPGNGASENAPRALIAASFTNGAVGSAVVTGAAGSALPGATVTVTDTAPAGTTGTTVANADGSWSLTLNHVPTTASNLVGTETILQGVGTSATTTVAAL
jgi:hypothetical protein